MPADQPPREIDAVSVALVRDGAVLLVRRGREPSRGQYAFPGGRVEPGESFEQAAARELLEETGLAVSGLSPLRDVVIDSVRDGMAVRYRLRVFAGMPGPGDPVPGDDADLAGWFRPEELGGLQITGSTLDIALELLGV